MNVKKEKIFELKFNRLKIELQLTSKIRMFILKFEYFRIQVVKTKVGQILVRPGVVEIGG